MKIKLLKPLLIGENEKPEGMTMEVINEYGLELIADGTAESADPVDAASEEEVVKKTSKTK